jgi:uncharacterized protein YpmB
MKVKELKKLAILTSIFTVIIFSSNYFVYRQEKTLEEEIFIDRGI